MREGVVLTALSLFSGIGGLDIAAHAAGIETVAFCEIEPFKGGAYVACASTTMTGG